MTTKEVKPVGTTLYWGWANGMIKVRSKHGVVRFDCTERKAEDMALELMYLTGAKRTQEANFYSIGNPKIQVYK